MYMSDLDDYAEER